VKLLRSGGVIRAFALGVAVGLAAASLAGCAGQAEGTVEIDIHYSHFSPSEITVPAGVPVTFTLRNEDPIDHEWIVGDEEIHAVHRTSKEPIHDDRPTEVTLPALATRTTTITFEQPGRLLFICHLPGHEAYGMVGVLTVAP
jgi:uncharacterized cupredoxin-like copper-binding protein